MSTIAAGTTTTTALVQTGDTTGSLVLQTGATPTTAMTISSSQIVNFANAPTIGGSAFPSGAMTLISTQTAAGTAYLQWTGLSGYDKYQIVLNNISHTAFHVSAGLILQIGTGATPTWITSGYQWVAVCHLTNASTSVSIYNSNSDTSWSIGAQASGQPSGGTGAGVIGSLQIAGCSGSTSLRSFSGIAQSYNSSTPVYEQDVSTGTSASATPITAIRISFADTSVAIGTGSATLYGISS